MELLLAPNPTPRRLRGVAGAGLALLVAVLAGTLAARAHGADDPQEAIAALNARVEAAEAAGAPPLERATLHHELGRALVAHGDHAAAETEFRRALALREAELPPGDEGVVASLTGLGVAVAAQGRSDEGERLLRDAVARREKALGRDAPEVGTALMNLAALYTQLGRLDEAAAASDRALAIQERSVKGGADPADLVTALRNRAVLYDRQGKPGKADAVWERIARVELEVHGPGAVAAAAAHVTLADRRRAHGDADGARSHYETALGILGAAERPDPRSVAHCMAGLGWVARKDGRAGDAETRYRRALGILERAVGRDDPSLAPVLRDYAELLRAQGRAADADALTARATRIAPEADR